MLPRPARLIWRGPYLYFDDNPHAVERLVPGGVEGLWKLPDEIGALPLEAARAHAEEVARKRRRQMGRMGDREHDVARALRQLDDAIGVPNAAQL